MVKARRNKETPGPLFACQQSQQRTGVCSIPQKTAKRSSIRRTLPSSAGLRYVSDVRPGIRRKRSGKGFSYVRPDGTKLSDPQVVRRIRSLAIPPAWTNVWICPVADGHIQATGRDAKGRKQYRYHPQFREVRESTKYEHIVAFANALPAIRAKVREHIARRGLPREKVLATVVHLLETTSSASGTTTTPSRTRAMG